MDKNAKNMEYIGKNRSDDSDVQKDDGTDQYRLNLSNVVRSSLFMPRVRYLGYNPAVSYVNRNVQHNNTVNIEIFLSTSSPRFIRAVDGRNEHLRAPFVCLTGPGYTYDTLTLEDREELHFSYDKSDIQYLNYMGIDHASPGIELSEDSPILSLAQRILDLFSSIYEKGNIDRVDRLCEMILIELSIHIRSGNKKEIANEKTVRQMAEYLRTHYREKINWDKFIASHSLSKRSFYRYWRSIFSVNPATYLTKMKIDIACGVLKNSSRQISEIAEELNYDDPLYFSKCFKKITGMSPRQYRESSINAH